MKRDPSSVARPTPQKPPKMDRKLVAKSQDYEVDYISHKYDIPEKEVRNAIEKVGRSRRKIYEYLRSIGYTVGKK